MSGSETLVLELASGSGRFSQHFCRDQLKAVPVDRARSNFTREVPTFAGDLSEERVQDYLIDLVRSGRVAHIHMSCPGTSFDRNRGPRERLRRKGAPQSRDLRDAAHPWGRPARADRDGGLDVHEQTKVERDNSVVKFYEMLINECHDASGRLVDAGVTWTLEALSLIHI